MNPHKAKPPVMLWGNNVFHELPFREDIMMTESNKYIQSTITGYIISLIPWTYEEVMVYTKNQAKPFNNLVELTKAWSA